MDIFVYGTLMSPRLFQAIAGGKIGTPQHATLQGYARYLAQDVNVPFIDKNADSTVSGIVWRGLNAAQVARVDLYESAFGYTPDAVFVLLDAGSAQVNCYLPPKGLAAADTAWSLAAWEDASLTPALLAADEVFSHEPLPTPAALRRMWPMIESRAWAKYRVRVAPATLRHDATPGDMTIVSSRAPVGEFYRMQNIDVHHKMFSGVRSKTLNREVFIAVDAAFVLPYDPVRDKVLLVEQVRVGPTVRRDPNPWMLEPIAGIIDAGETPEQAAHRETAEEAALTVTRLEPVAEFYASPGATTDYFYTYIGLCDLPIDDTYLGGLASEGEDIRLHPIPFERAMELADSGEIQVGPLLLMLNWLARHRDRLRATA